jgi:hypothetical protein
VQFGVDEVDLAEVGPVGILLYQVAVPDLLPQERVTFDAQTGEESDARLILLGHRV